VIDPGGGSGPRARDVDPLCESGGLGLHIVAALSTTWGHCRGGNGQRVWFEISR
jgi:hypothetical protein